MVARNTLLQAPPYAVEQALKRFGTNLRTARIRRRLTVEDVAQKIGTGVRAILDAEKGKPSTSAAVYTALLWAFGLLNDFEALADPARDSEGQTLALAREGSRVRHRTGKTGGLDNDF
ncbi:MAG: helix-turn-helix domain-containing protein [Oligoflexia bacterium]|nr:helix-turn-helix domain-containing protein [Oligoflexia bacterium]